MMNRAFWLTMALLFNVGVVSSQSQDTAAEESAAAEVDSVAVEPIDDDPLAELNAAESQTEVDGKVESGAEEPVVEDPLAESNSAESQTETDASLQRFVPSEKISEDRSVAFPNDI